MNLVIIESPAKAKTLSKILGKDYTVKASVGHIMDLPAKELGVDTDNDFKPRYGIIPGKEKVIEELKRAAKGAGRIYLAPDPDREGEAIASHIATVLKKSAGEVYRAAFNEITERAVKEAINNPGRIDMKKVEAQQARRVLDRLVGYNLSPLLWKKVRRGLSAGRVQSVAVRLVAEREKEIEAFNQEEYWTIEAKLAGAMPPEFAASLHNYGGSLVIDNRESLEKGKRFLLTDAEAAQKAADVLSKGKFSVGRVEKKHRKRNPNAPFITSTLQQEASRKLGFTTKKTMLLAQQLYEGVELGEEGSVGLITYMRTDSVRVAGEAQQWARQFIEKTFGKDYLPEKPPVYKSRAAAQEAHEAVRPTFMEKTPEGAKPFLPRDHYRLYNLIWNRFIASQMRPAELEQTTMDITCGCDVPSTLRATGSIVKFPGFMALYMESLDGAAEEEGAILPPLKEGEGVSMKAIEPKQHFTQPPPRYTEASLVRALEEKGIGRPSTYAAILSTIVDRKYVHKIEKNFAPTELGVLVNGYLVERFPELLDVDFTARMEDELDHIEDGKFEWVKVVRDFYDPFSKSLAEAAQTVGKVKPEDIPTEEACEKCGSPMVIRWGRHGRFKACSGYPNCKNTKPMDSDKPVSEPEPTGENCDKCGSPMLIRTGKFGKFIACSNYPKCKNTKPVPTGVKCPLDGGDIVGRRARGGRTFWSCSNYPDCKFSVWNRPVPGKCPKCGAEFLLVMKDKTGDLFHVCHNKECGFKEAVKEAV